MSKFQDDLLNKGYLLRIDCRSVNNVLENDVKNIYFEHIFVKLQAILCFFFYFELDYVKGEDNSLPDFLTIESLQGSKES